MAYNGSGTFLINSAGQPVVAATVISSTTFNALTADLATGLSTVITKDGQTTVTANIPMATYKFTGLGVGSAATDSATLSQVQSTVTKLLASVSGADTVTATASPTLAAYAAGQMFYFVAAGDNTTSVTLNIDALGAKAVTRDGSVALAAADIKSGEVVVVVYDGTRFQVVSQLNSAGDARFANVSIASSLYVGGVSTFVGNAGFSANVSITSALSVGGVATFAAGSAAAPSITTTGDSNTGIFFPAADTIAFTEGGVESMRIDSSGNVGLGVTPSAFSGAGKNMQFGNGPASIGTQNSGDANFMHNAYESPNGTFKYVGSGIGALRYQLDINNNVHKWYYAASGTANNNISFTQAMTLDASGNLGLGVTPSAWYTTGGVSRWIEMPNGVSFGDYGGSTTVGNNWFANTSGGDIYKITGYAAQYVQTSGTHVWKIAGVGTAGDAITFTEAMKLDTSGNLGIGTTSPTTRLHINGTSGQYLRSFSTSNSVDSYFGSQTNEATVTVASNHPLTFVTNSTERARITAAGELLLGATSQFNSGKQCIAFSGTAYYGISLKDTVDQTNARFIGFINGSGTVIGSIDRVTTTNAVVYNTTSDYRLKTVLGAVANAGQRIDALQPVDYRWNDNGERARGFLAHQFQEVYASSVTGIKDAVDTDGKPVYQAMQASTSEVIADLVAELQSLRKRVAELESK